MSVSRRSVLWNSVLAALAFAASPLRSWSRTPNSGPNPKPGNITGGSLQHLDRPAFTREIGTSFKVSPTSGKGDSVWLRLIKIEELPALVPVNSASMAVPPPKKTSAEVHTVGYMLIFLGTMAEQLRQDTYTFSHAGLGTFTLLLVPGPKGDQTYTAVINRLP
jgi:hypothetical protein